VKRFMNKKVAAIGLAAGLALGTAGAAFAYFSSTGSGSGSASTGSSTSVAISQTNTVSGLLPGGPSQTIDYSVTNNGSGSEYVGQVTVSVASVTSGSLADETCATSMYPIVQGAPINADVPAGQTVNGTATISMTDDGNNQDNCQAANGGGALTLSFGSD
jgi:hypothetical protein